MISYLIDVSVCLAVFYLFYRCFLSRVKLLNANRGYLMISSALALIIPLLNIPMGGEEIYYAFDRTPAAPGIGEIMTNVKEGYNVNPWKLIYFAGLFISLGHLIVSLVRLLKSIKKNQKLKSLGLTFVFTDDIPLSSFFHFVFVPEGFDPKSAAAVPMLKHERVHVRDRHSIDLLLVNLLKCFFWFNPFAHLIKHAVKTQHEFIVDEAVSKTMGREAYSETLIYHSLQQSGVPLAHAFAEHPIEKRLEMILKSNPTTMKKLRLVWSLPLIFVLTFTLGFDKQIYSQTTEEVNAAEVNAAPKSASQIINGKVVDSDSEKGLDKVTVFFRPSNSGTVTNAEGNYKTLPGKTDTLMVFRKRGYEDVSVPVKNYEVVNVKLTKKQDGKAGTANKRIKGKVQANKTGLKLDGVLVKAIPSGKKTTTNKDGFYEIELTKGDSVLQFSKVDFENMEVPRRRFSVLNIALKEKKKP